MCEGLHLKGANEGVSLKGLSYVVLCCVQVQEASLKWKVTIMQYAIVQMRAALVPYKMRITKILSALFAAQSKVILLLPMHNLAIISVITIIHLHILSTEGLVCICTSLLPVL